MSAEDKKEQTSSSSSDTVVEEEVKQSHLMYVAELRFAYSVDRDEGVKEQLLAAITENKMAPFYRQSVTAFGWMEDEALLTSLTAKNEEELKALDAKIEDAEKNQGETEVRDALVAKADFYARIGDKTAALAAYDVAMAKTVGVGPRIDLSFSVLLVALFFTDVELLKKKLDETKKMVEEGGDWDRRNRLKVYRALHHLLVRDFKSAASLLLDCIATFTATELFGYATFVRYVVLAAMMTVTRSVLNDKVIRSPEIFGSISEVAHLNSLLHALHGCKYADFFPALTAVLDGARTDRFLAPHSRYLLRELRLVAYTQFLVSYRSVTLGAMARAFGVSVALLDSDLAQFIYAGRLSCKIDKVGGIVETTRPDARNAQYAAVIKQGDALLSRVQKLSRVIAY